MRYYFDSRNYNSVELISDQLKMLINNSIQPNQEIVILCIGSDRSTGDSLGPIVGYNLKNAFLPGFFIYGDLDNPVHATNLCTYMKHINRIFVNPYIIALDASLGVDEHIGYITLGTGPLKPGLGVKKKLPAVGNIHITGIVNSSRNMDFTTLQTTRLNIIFQIANTITMALKNINDDFYISQPPERSCQLTQIS